MIAESHFGKTLGSATHLQSGAADNEMPRTNPHVASLQARAHRITPSGARSWLLGMSALIVSLTTSALSADVNVLIVGTTKDAGELSV